MGYNNLYFKCDDHFSQHWKIVNIVIKKKKWEDEVEEKNHGRKKKGFKIVMILLL